MNSAQEKQIWHGFYLQKWSENDEFRFLKNSGYGTARKGGKHLERIVVTDENKNYGSGGLFFSFYCSVGVSKSRMNH